MLLCWTNSKLGQQEIWSNWARMVNRCIPHNLLKSCVEMLQMEKVSMSQSRVHEFRETAKSHGWRVLYYIYANATIHEIHGWEKQHIKFCGCVKKMTCCHYVLRVNVSSMPRACRKWEFLKEILQNAILEPFNVSVIDTYCRCLQMIVVTNCK